MVQARRRRHCLEQINKDQLRQLSALSGSRATQPSFCRAPATRPAGFGSAHDRSPPISRSDLYGLLWSLINLAVRPPLAERKQLHSQLLAIALSKVVATGHWAYTSCSPRRYINRVRHASKPSAVPRFSTRLSYPQHPSFTRSHSTRLIRPSPVIDLSSSCLKSDRDQNVQQGHSQPPIQPL